MHRFTLRVYVVVGDVLEVKFLFFQKKAGDLHFGFLFAHNFKQN